MGEAADLSLPIEELPGVGPVRGAAYRREGIETGRDLLAWLPERHRRRPPLMRVSDLEDGLRAVVRGRVVAAHARRRGRRGYARLEIEDGSGRVAVYAFGRPYLARSLRRGEEVAFAGRAQQRDGKILFGAEEVLDPAEVEPAGGFVPVYRLPPEIPPRLHRRLVVRLLAAAEGLSDWRHEARLPPREGLVPLGEALRAAHRPRDAGDHERARRRFAYEEFVRLLAALGRRREGAERRAVRLEIGEREVERALAGWPFEATASQRRALARVAADLASGRAMHRLLQGDVGTGKTAVLLEAARLVARRGAQVALLAPTELLALQHARTARAWFGAGGSEIVTLVGSDPSSRRRAALERLSSPRPLVAIGTHAVLGDSVLLPRLVLAIVDEQQRFGVAQRARLRDKRPGVHYLVATATPIPRTLLLTLYGDLEVTRLEERPAGRRPVATEVLSGDGAVEGALRRIGRALEEGGAAFAVCPFVDPPPERPWLGATRLYEHCRRRFGAARVRLAHGRTPADENARALDDLREGRARLLVSTVVVEVGVDVPGATHVVVFGAERLGLAALHQLRGRVGRGARPGTCLLVTSTGDARALERLRVLEQTSDGLEVAERDLALRGGGRVFGLRQSGNLETLHADPLGDLDLLEYAREDLERLVRTGRRPVPPLGRDEALERGAPCEPGPG